MRTGGRRGRSDYEARRNLILKIVEKVSKMKYSRWLTNLAKYERKKEALRNRDKRMGSFRLKHWKFKLAGAQ